MVLDEARAAATRFAPGNLGRDGQEQLVDQTGSEEASQEARPSLAHDEVRTTFRELGDDRGATS